MWNVRKNQNVTEVEAVTGRQRRGRFAITNCCLWRWLWCLLVIILCTGQYCFYDLLFFYVHVCGEMGDGRSCWHVVLAFENS